MKNNIEEIADTYISFSMLKYIESKKMIVSQILNMKKMTKKVTINFAI